MSQIGPHIFNMRPDSYSSRFRQIIYHHNDELRKYKADKTSKNQYAPKGRQSRYKKFIEFNLQNKPLPNIRFHDLRHYHASDMFRNGIPDQYAAERLGHNIMVLKKVYQHLGDALAKKPTDNIMRERYSSNNISTR